ncbi:unannotated protein [freshwater metagenome]|uniref:Unannotated protein n=1 Tax=freshwater metagenome TaxID=449393 RepID=A0A6J5ZSB5_9ZZZZ
MPVNEANADQNVVMIATAHTPAIPPGTEYGRTA